jgi:beta-lactamase superfamily II metal-dependent hydrolase
MIPWYCAFATGIPALYWKETRSAWSNKDWWRRTIRRRTCSRVGHHGSNTSSTAELLNAVHPRWAIISVGARNTFGHPRIETLKRLEGLGTATYRTDRNGAVTFYLDGHTVNPQLACLR